MQITHPKKDQAGYQISWIIEDHDPGADEDYNSTLAKYGYEVYTDLDEAKRYLKAHVTKSEVMWGNIREVYFRFMDGFPHGWEDCDPDAEHLVYAEDLFDT